MPVSSVRATCAWPDCEREAIARVEYIQRPKANHIWLAWLAGDGVALLCADHVEELEVAGVLIVSVMLVPPA